MPAGLLDGSETAKKMPFKVEPQRKKRLTPKRIGSGVTLSIGIKEIPLAVGQKGKKTADPKTNRVQRHAGAGEGT